MGSTKTCQNLYHSVPNWGSYWQKTAIGQFSPKFSGAPGAKTMGHIQKSYWYKNETDVLYALAKFGGDRWTHGDRRWRTVMFFVCMFVFLYVCHAGCAGKRSGRSATYNVTVCRAISILLSLNHWNKLNNRSPHTQHAQEVNFDDRLTSNTDHLINNDYIVNDKYEVNTNYIQHATHAHTNPRQAHLQNLQACLK